MNFSKAYNRAEWCSFLQNSFLPEDFELKEEIIEPTTQTKYTTKVTKLGASAQLDLVVYEIYHSSSNDARVSLSREAFRLLADEMQGRALVLFVPENDSKVYRFSFIEITLEWNDTKINKSYSNPRRFSFRLGEGIATHTPDQYLIAKGRVVDEKDLRNRFSVEVLTKEFYSELSDWYAWAIKLIKFPNDINDPNDDEKYNNEGAIRLITRLIFVWFLKQRLLIPDEFFDEQYLSEHLLKDFDPHARHGWFNHEVNKTIYYKAILQNLFFAMLNCPITAEGSTELTERHFRREGGNVGYSRLMRYESLFKDPDLFVSLANNTVPFLNGGLFDCLDDREKGIYYDAFSERRDVQEGLVFPDFLFFGDNNGKTIDLSDWYGDKNKRQVSARGIIDILKRYNFTVEENTPFDKEVSLDPELLGKAFENLLAAYNPETKTTARKQTGSFYTPREIVQYMVDESLVAHLKRTVGEDLETEYRKLLAYEEQEINLTEEQRHDIMLSLYNCKILDPACGSGAFPVGILQQMVHVLNQIDSDNHMWRELMERQATDETSEAFRAATKEERDELLADISRTFDQSINGPDYARKLYLIENCIYGVDIQPIAIQISKLRFFISLVIDQKTNNNPVDNFGIRPLPNLEAKFVAANTLIGLSSSQELAISDTSAVLQKKKEMKEVKHRIFSAKTYKTKKKYKDRMSELRQELADTLLADGFVTEGESLQLASWDMFDQNASSPFFDPDWMFGVKDGFDIVIGNPPYVNANELKKNLGETAYQQMKSLYETAKGAVDFYVYFFEKGLKLLVDMGVLSYITPNKFLSANYGKHLRQYIIDNAQITLLRDVSRDCIFDASVYPVITFLLKGDSENYTISSVHENGHMIRFSSLQLCAFPDYIWGFLLSSKYELTSRIVNNSRSLLEICKINATSTASEADKFHKYITQSHDNGYKLINTGTIDPYVSLWGIRELTDKGCKYLQPYLPNEESLLGHNRYTLYGSPKIIVAKMAAKFEGYLDIDGSYASINTNCFHSFNCDCTILLGWLHSKVFHYIYECYFESLKMSGGYLPFTAPYLSCMCYPKGLFESGMGNYVRLILSAKQSDPFADTSALENEIDFMVYKLYGLTYDEVLIVDPDTPIQREEYENA